MAVQALICQTECHLGVHAGVLKLTFMCGFDKSQSWPKIVWTTAKIGAVTDTTSNVQPII